MKMLKLVLVCSILVVAFTASQAQPGGGGPGGGGPPVPITGIELLVGGGAILGIRKILSRRNASGDK